MSAHARGSAACRPSRYAGIAADANKIPFSACAATYADGGDSTPYNGEISAG